MFLARWGIVPLARRPGVRLDRCVVAHGMELTGLIKVDGIGFVIRLKAARQRVLLFRRFALVAAAAQHGLRAGRGRSLLVFSENPECRTRKKNNVS